MTTGIIYHDFQADARPAKPAPAAVLTAPILEKGRRRAKTWARVNTAVNGACLALCGACIGVSVFILGCIMVLGT